MSVALELTGEQKSFPEFVRQVCKLCVYVQDTSRAVCMLRTDRVHVDLSNQDFGQFAPLQQSSSLAEVVLWTKHQPSTTQRLASMLLSS